MSDNNSATVNFDVLASASPLAAPAQDAPAPEPVKSVEPVLAGAKDVSAVVDEDTLKELGLEKVLTGFFLAPDVTFTVSRRAWNGITKPKSNRVKGIRPELRKLGFEVVEKVHANGKDGKLSSAVYSDGEYNLTVEYGKGKKFAHLISAS